jgi:multicomponent Na+:H+ antiporter subunit A
MSPLRPESIILIWLIALPFFAAFCAEIFPRLRLPGRLGEEADSLRAGPFSLGVMASVMGMILAASLLPVIHRGETISADYWWTRDLYHLRFQADLLAAPLVIGLHALGLLLHLHMAGLPPARFAHHRAALALIAQGCGAAACLSADIIALLFCLQLVTVALWGLGYLDDRRAANRMLATIYAAGLLLVAAALLLWQRAGDSSTAALPFLMVAASPAAHRTIGLLALFGLLPLVPGLPGHGWLPHLASRAHAAACASAVFLPLVGGVTLLRILPGSLMLPSIPVLRPVLFALSAATLLWGAARALAARELHHLAAWLTVAQGGLLLATLAAVAGPEVSPELMGAAPLQLAAASLAVAATWSAVGAVKAAVGTDTIGGLSGMIGRSPLAGAILLLGGASLAGIPPLPGFLVQRLLIPALVGDGHAWMAAVILCADLLVAAAVLNALRLVFLRAEPPPSLRWSSPWLSVQLALAGLALIAVCLQAGPVVGWSEEAARSVPSAVGSSAP